MEKNHPSTSKPLFPNWISTGNVLTMIGMAVGGLWVLGAMSTAQAVQNEKIAATNEQIRRMEQSQQREREEIKQELQMIRADMKELLRRQQPR